MAAQDVSRYQFFIEAFRYKIKFKDNPEADKYGGWSFEGEGGIFDRARRNFPQVYNDKSLYPENPKGNLEYAKNLINKLDLHQDSVLEGYFKGETSPTLDEETGSKTNQAIQQLEQARAGASAYPGGAYSGGIPTISSAPYISRTPGIRRMEKTPVKTYPKPPVVETGLDYEGKPYEMDAEYMAQKEAAAAKTSKTTKAASQAKSEGPATRTLGRRFQVPSGVSNAARGFGSSAGRAFGGAVGGGGRFLGRLGIGGLNTFGRFSDEITRRRAVLRGSSSKRVVLLFVGGFIVLTFLTGFTGAGTPPIPGVGEPTPPPPPPSVGPPGVASDCPVVGGKISTHSYRADPKKGHCTDGYLLEGRCRQDCPEGKGENRRAKAIDVYIPGQSSVDVVLPTVSGQKVNWTLVQHYYVAPKDGGGQGYTLDTILGSDKWTLDILHLGNSSLQKGDVISSGTSVGKTDINHVHTTIGKGVKNSAGAGSFDTDCDAGWLASDFMCQ